MPKQTSWRNKHLPRGLRILFEDDAVLVVDKPPGLLTVATDRQQDRTAYHALTDYVRKGQTKARNRVFIVHRLDQDTSGVLVFAKTERAKDYLQGRWNDAEKIYLAVVYGSLGEESGTITSNLVESESRKVYSTRAKGEGRFAQTQYRVLKKNKVYSLLEVKLLTGRKHQIRVHLADMGHPVVGDRKYGAKDATQRRLALHAWRLAIPRPVTGERIVFESDVPRHFERLMGGAMPS